MSFDKLLALKDHPRADRRAFCMRKIGEAAERTRPLPEAAVTLIAGAADADYEVRKWAAWSLRELRVPEALPTLLQRLQCEPGSWLRQFCAISLNELAPNNLPAEPLVRVLADPEPWLRRWACATLAACRREEAIPAVRGLALHPLWEVRVGAIAALAELAPEASELPSLLVDHLKASEAEVPDRFRERVQLETAWERVSGAPWEAKLTLETARAALREGDAGARLHAIRSLVRLGDRPAIDGVEEYLEDPVPEVRTAAVEGIVGLALWSGYQDVWRYGRNSLDDTPLPGMPGGGCDPGQYERWTERCFLRLRHDAVPRVRAAALRLLLDQDAARYWETVCRQAASDPAPEVKLAIHRAISQGRRVMHCFSGEFWKERFRDPSDAVFISACECRLDPLGNEELLAVLGRLEAPSFPVRLAIYRLLVRQQVGDSGLVRSIEAAVQSPEGQAWDQRLDAVERALPLKPLWTEPDELRRSGIWKLSDLLSRARLDLEGLRGSTPWP